MKEIWKPVVGYEGRYEVSNLGNVASLNYAGRGYRKNLKLCDDKDGYKVVSLDRASNHFFRVHRLVAEAFIPNENCYEIINHIDENKANNYVGNLEWCSYKHNSNHGKGKYVGGEKRKKPIIATFENGTEHYFNSQKDAGEELGINPASICQALKGKQKTAGGKRWRYAK